MKEVATKIGDVEVTPGVAEFLNNMLMPDVNRLAVEGYIDDLRNVQDFLTRLLLELADPDPKTVESCLSTVMTIGDQLSLLMPEKGGAQ